MTLKNTVNALVMLSSSCKGKNVKIFIAVTMNSLLLSLITLSMVSLKKKKSKKEKPSKKKNPQKAYEILNTFSNISSPWIKRKTMLSILKATKGKCQESKCRIKLLQLRKASTVSPTK